MNNIQNYRNKLEQLKGSKKSTEQKVINLKQTIKTKKTQIKSNEEALEIVKVVGIKTQQQLQFHISNITSTAMKAVFKNPYEVKVEFVERRNKTECDILFTRNGEKYKPIDDSGIGAVDVAAFALRIAAWSMKSPRTNSLILLDEPFKHLRGERENEKVLEMIKEISEKLDLQIIMIGDVKVSKDILLDYADKLFNTSIKNGITKIKEL